MHACIRSEPARVRLGSGRKAYERGREALLQWRMHEGSPWARIVVVPKPTRHDLKVCVEASLECHPEEVKQARGGACLSQNLFPFPSHRAEPTSSLCRDLLLRFFVCFRGCMVVYKARTSG